MGNKNITGDLKVSGVIKNADNMPYGVAFYKHTIVVNQSDPKTLEAIMLQNSAITGASQLLYAFFIIYGNCHCYYDEIGGSILSMAEDGTFAVNFTIRDIVSDTIVRYN